MPLIDIYRPDLLHDFFVMVGGASAALTGLVFVALSINLKIIANDATHRYRAIGTLTGFMSGFAICALGLILVQNYQVIGIGWIIVAIFALIIYDNGIIQAKKLGTSRTGLITYRIFIGNFLYIAEIIGAIMLTLGYAIGAYIASISLIALISYTTTGAWLLLMGVHQNK